MRFELRIIIPVSIATAALVLGGSGCKKSAPKDLSSSASSVGSGLVHGDATVGHISPSDLAKGEIARQQGAEGSAQGSAQAPAQPLEPTCFTETFYHKSMSGHSDEESCSHHKNLLVLSHKGVNPAHVCVRVNGTPVKFQRKGEEVLIGSIAGPKAKITVRYCTGKLTCAEVAKEDCTVPKDEFMDALGGGGADETVQWEAANANPEDAKLNAEVKKELADIDGVESGEKDGRAPAHAAVFKEWIREEDAPACKKQAS